MGYRIAQNEEYRGHNFWNWSAWIESTPEDLDQVEFVVWVLHPTFDPSRVECHSRDTNFRLDTSGWGIFRLRAELHLKNKETILISRMLRLTVPNDQEETSSISTIPLRFTTKNSMENTPTVFLSYSSEDESQAQEIRQTVENLGARVLDARSISSGLPLTAAIKKLIRESDAVIGVIGSEYPSPYVIDEMKTATAQDKPVVTFLPDNIDSPLGLSSDVQMLRVGKDNKLTNSLIAGFVEKLRTADRD
ncbi:MAG: TIR domain-containing protein [Nitrospira sp.]|nr:TIR domain-containing protein [Nitrospira sp.]